MFDDPKKELKRLQDRLLAAEEDDWKQTDDDPDAALEAVKKILARDDWEEKHREPLYRSYVPQEPEDAEEYPEDDPESIPETKRKTHIGGLLIALILETMALVAVVAWWLLWR